MLSSASTRDIYNQFFSLISYTYLEKGEDRSHQHHVCRKIWQFWHWASLRFKKQKISIVFEDLSRNSVFFWTEVKPYLTHRNPEVPPNTPSASPREPQPSGSGSIATTWGGGVKLENLWNKNEKTRGEGWNKKKKAQSQLRWLTTHKQGLITIKQTMTRPVASAAPHPITLAWGGGGGDEEYWRILSQSQ